MVHFQNIEAEAEVVEEQTANTLDPFLLHWQCGSGLI
jgi:hypothetical protein